MIYQWSGRTFGIDPQAAGEEVERIARQRGKAALASVIVEESRPDDAPLHPAFEWDDEVAAEEYRKEQARNLVQSLVVVFERSDGKADRLPGFYHVDYTEGESRVRGYQPISVVSSQSESRQSAEQYLLRQLRGLKRRHVALKAFKPVWDAIDAVDEQIAS